MQMKLFYNGAYLNEWKLELKFSFMARMEFHAISEFRRRCWKRSTSRMYLLLLLYSLSLSLLTIDEKLADFLTELVFPGGQRCSSERSSTYA
jgi:hypothetical protein